MVHSMRILHLDTGREMRGGQWQALYLMEGLANAGHSAILLAPHGSPLAAAAQAKGFAVQPPAALARASRSADLVHAHDARAHTLAALCSRKPLVVARRVAFPLRRGPLSRWKYRRAAHFVAVSDFVRKQLILGGVDDGRISVVFDGVPPAEPARECTRIVAPASGDPGKGMALAAAASALGGFEVHFSRDLPRDLQNAALLLYISDSEGLGSGALLAAAAGVPAVASRTGGLAEAVLDGRTGLLVENTPESIATAVRRMLEDPERARRMGAAARSRARTLFSLEAMIQGTLRVYHRVLSSC
jgi:hypothetical protein